MTKRVMRRIAMCVLLLVVFLSMAAVGSLSYFHFASPKNTCFSCHEMHISMDHWASSSHRNVHCRNCHGGSMTMDVHALKQHAGRLVGHFSRAPAEDLKLTEPDILAISGKCRNCHEHEYADWSSSGHSVTYSAIFLNEKQNRSEQLNADCLRCHGMFFEGTTADVVTPMDTKGPWKLVNADLANRPVIPCATCHELHRKGEPAKRPESVDPKLISAGRKPRGSRAALYNRFEKAHFSADKLPVPSMSSDGRPVKVSEDSRLRLCVQCHAPDAFHASGTRDDRIPTGVHEGMSCAICHQAHSNNPKNSCMTCHPAMSHCGLDVREMDTTFKSADSKHNIHRVRCEDCHNGRRPG